MALPAYAMSRASFPEMFERLLVNPLFRPFAEGVLDQTPLEPGHALLDIACGTGIVARLAKQRLGASGTVAGVDASPGMLNVARGVAPGIDWREGSAAALPLRPGETFDVATCHQGLQFVPDKPAAIREMCRALKPGGRVAIATWRPDTEMPFLAQLRSIAEKYLGPIEDKRFSLGDPSALESLLRDAGFNSIHVATIERALRFPDSSGFLRLNTIAFLGMTDAAKAMTDQRRTQVIDTILAASIAAARPYTSTYGLCFPMKTCIATGAA